MGTDNVFIPTTTGEAKGMAITEMMKFEHIFSVMTIVAFLYLSFMMVRALSPMAAGAAMGVWKKGARLGIGATKFVGGAASKRIGRSLASGDKGVLGKAVGNVLNPVDAIFRRNNPEAQKRISESAKQARFLSPRVWKEAHNARQAKLDQRAYGAGVGYVRTKMNSMLFDKDKTDYERQGRQALVNEYMDEYKKANPGLRHQQLSVSLEDAVRSDDKERIEAVIRLMSSTADFNEVYRNVAMKPELRGMFHTQDFINGKHYDPKTGKALEGEELEYAKTMAKGNSYYAQQDMFKKLLGKEDGIQLFTDLIPIDRNNGVMVSAEGVDYNEKEGRVEQESLMKQAMGHAVDFEKMEADARNRQARHTYVSERYNEKGDEIWDTLQGGARVWLKEFGASEEQTKRVPRTMSPRTQQAIAACFDDVSRVIDEMKKEAKELAASGTSEGTAKAATINARIERNKKFFDTVAVSVDPATTRRFGVKLDSDESSEKKKTSRQIADEKMSEISGGKL